MTTDDINRTYFWSRQPGKYVNKLTGEEIPNELGIQFIGTVREWFETLVEHIIDAKNLVFKRNLQAPKRLEVGRDILAILECCTAYRGVHKINKKEFKYVNVNPSNGQHVGSLYGQLEVFVNDNLPANEVAIILKSPFRVAIDVTSESTKVLDLALKFTERYPEERVIDTFTIKVLDF